MPRTFHDQFRANTVKWARGMKWIERRTQGAVMAFVALVRRRKRAAVAKQNVKRGGSRACASSSHRAGLAGVLGAVIFDGWHMHDAAHFV